MPPGEPGDRGLLGRGLLGSQTLALAPTGTLLVESFPDLLLALASRHCFLCSRGPVWTVPLRASRRAPQPLFAYGEGGGYRRPGSPSRRPPGPTPSGCGPAWRLAALRRSGVGHGNPDGRRLHVLNADPQARRPRARRRRVRVVPGRLPILRARGWTHGPEFYDPGQIGPDIRLHGLVKAHHQRVNSPAWTI